MASITYKDAGGRIKETEYPGSQIFCAALPQSTPKTTPQHHPKIEMLDIAETPQRSALAERTELPSMGEMSDR